MKLWINIGTWNVMTIFKPGKMNDQRHTGRMMLKKTQHKTQPKTGSVTDVQ